MMSVIESNVMVNPINEPNGFKILDTEKRVSQSSVAAKENHSEENNVNLSTTSKQMAVLKEFILSAPDIDKSRVEFVKEELATGRYHIVSKQIAEKMFADIKLS
ncbi:MULTISPECIES: flagellar biosynthesis anti-sigma factor FlgM [unclassified Legionella]|uniref:flagellar biosynthesis anti-sigma factor FlgM n=1 Tax=unclassified Legionella TaxID=2622702 RepID=UPI00105585C0|nr:MULTISPECIES: flagellar biosynthesis anti-sigma factor FlgM [unclassified Legionella]MDI9819295.1 flagellar biosynthesis anti-sigma factor FlgM [Legionella sp. PL877]